VAAFFAEKELQASYALFPDGESAVAQNAIYDLAFIDIEMPGINGLAVAKCLQERNAHIIIFMVTSHPGYIDDAMDITVFRYLPKPINQERLYCGLEKALDKYNLQNQTILLDSEDDSIPVFTQDILFICIQGRATQVKTKSCEYPSRKTLAQWQDELSQGLFAQPHQSYLVNLQHVSSLRKREVRLTEDNKGNHVFVPVSQRRYAAFKESFARYLGRKKT